MTQVPQECLIVPQAGDNKETPAKNLKYRTIFGTWYTYMPQCLSTKAWLDEMPKSKYCMQEEVCPTTGREHIQFKVHFGTQLRLSQIRVYFPEGAAFFKGEPAHLQKNWEYCRKDESKKPGGFRWERNIPEKAIPVEDPMAGLTPYPYQEYILNLVGSTPDTRTIHWFFDREGCKGKTSIQKHICLSNKKALLVGGVAKDIQFGVVSFKQTTGNGAKIVMWNLVRSKGNHISYTAVEEVKDGLFYSGKYESGMYIDNPPHVIVFANEPPEMEKLSKDRWKVFEIFEGDSFELWVPPSIHISA